MRYILSGMRISSTLLSSFILVAGCSNDLTEPHDHDHDHQGGAGSSEHNETGDASGGSDHLGGATGSGGVHDGTGGASNSELSCSAPAACNLVECAAEDGGGAHVDLCSALAPHTNPPTSGPHYGYWAQFGIYDEPFPDGFLLHSLEHSAVALLYNCELVEEQGDSCNELISQLTELYQAWPEDSLCNEVPHRLMILPDPNLDVAFAATAWGHHLKGDCFDEARVTEFIEAHYGMNYEDLCSPGIDPHAAGCEQGGT